MKTSPRHLLHVFPTFEVGGSQARFSQLVNAHGARYRHTIVALDNVTDMASRLPADAFVEFRRVDFNKHRTLSNLPLFRRTIDDINPDVVVTYNWGAIEWALANRFLTGRRHVHIEDGFGQEEAQKQLRRRVWTRRLALSGRHTTVVVPSHVLEQLALRVWKLPAGRIRQISNGIDCNRFYVDVESRVGRQEPIVIGTLARLRKEKNVARLIEAFSAVASSLKNNALQLVIVGDGPEREALQALAKKSLHASQIRFAGATQKPEQWYHLMDVFALSSDTEQMPFSVLEAMAAGLPIVSPAVGDIANLVAADNASQIVASQDEVGFREAILALLNDAGLRLRLGRANQKKARQEFDEGIMAKRYAEVFG